MGLSYKEIKNIEKGTEFCESNYLLNVWYEMIDNPVEEFNGELKQLKWQGKNKESGEIQDFLITEGLEHYGPSIYFTEAYVDINQLRE